MIVQLRDTHVPFPCAVHVTAPLPVPLVGEIVTQSQLSLADHEHPDPIDTEIVPVPPPIGAVPLVGLIVHTHGLTVIAPWPPSLATQLLDASSASTWTLNFVVCETLGSVHEYVYHPAAPVALSPIYRHSTLSTDEYVLSSK